MHTKVRVNAAGVIDTGGQTNIKFKLTNADSLFNSVRSSNDYHHSSNNYHSNKINGSNNNDCSNKQHSSNG